MEEHQMSCKVYVDVMAEYTKDGRVWPVAFTWEDGIRYPIDKIKRVERCASRKAGGVGVRYTIMVGGRPYHLFFEFDRWFIERETEYQ